MTRKKFNPNLLIDSNFCPWFVGTKFREMMFSQIADAAATKATILFSGPTGSGKELYVRAFRECSSRHGNFVIVNAPALPKELIESELFGHNKGAFTGATERRVGKIQEAHGGILLIDEVSELDPASQPKFLRFLQEHSFEPVGSSQTIHVDIQVVATTNKNLSGLVQKGLFREDLYYRLAQKTIQVSPLCERSEDIPALADHFVKSISEEYDRIPPRIAEKAYLRLMEYGWPGNVRELRNCFSNLLSDTSLEEIKQEDLDPFMGTAIASNSSGFNVKRILEEIERTLYQKAIAATQGNQEKAAMLLGLSRSKYFRRKRILGLSR